MQHVPYLGLLCCTSTVDNQNVSCLFVCLSVYLSVSLPVILHILVYFFLSVPNFICVSVCLFTCLCIFLPASAYVRVYSLVCQSVCLFPFSSFLVPALLLFAAISKTFPARAQASANTFTSVCLLPGSRCFLQDGRAHCCLPRGRLTELDLLSRFSLLLFLAPTQTHKEYK